MSKNDDKSGGKTEDKTGGKTEDKTGDKTEGKADDKTVGRTKGASAFERAPAAAAVSGDGLLFVDTIEGGFARLLCGADAFDVPARLLPADAKEGSWLRPSFTLAPAPAADADAEALRRRLGQDDDGGDIKL
jgi:hypothetical protein